MTGEHGGKARVDDAAEVTFVADGRRIRARAGQSIAAAMVASGRRTLSRSLKFHRPRGYACGTGHCNQCMMRVDGVPNVKTCMTPARDGMIVVGQNAWPHVERDVFRAADIVFRKDLDHHHAFVRPRILYPLFGKVIRAFAGWGRLPDAPAPPRRTESLTPDVLVMGAGPAGLAAATAAAETGADVLLLDEHAEVGGHAARLRRDLPDPDDHDDATTAVQDGAGEDGSVMTIRADHLVTRWRNELRAHAEHIDHRPGTALAAAYRSGIVVAQNEDTLLLVRPKAMVIAGGGYSAQAVFTNNDLPGVMDATAAQRLLNQERVRPGTRALVVGAGAHGLHVALDLHQAGLDVVGVATPHATASAPQAFVADARRFGIAILPEHHLVAARGFGRVRAAELQGPDGRKRFNVDLIVIAHGRTTAPETFQALGADVVFDAQAGGAVPVLDANLQTTFPGLFAAGDVAGIGSLATARASGRLAGLSAAVVAGRPLRGLMAERERLRTRLQALLPTHGGPARLGAVTNISPAKTKTQAEKKAQTLRGSKVGLSRKPSGVRRTATKPVTSKSTTKKPTSNNTTKKTMSNKTTKKTASQKARKNPTSKKATKKTTARTTNKEQEQGTKKRTGGTRS